MSEYHDTELGEALRDLGLPEHGDDFFRELWARADREPSPGTARTEDAEAKSTGGRTGWWARPRACFAGLAAATFAAALIVAVALFGVPGFESAGPADATAADVLASMDHAGETLMTVTADIVTTFFEPNGNPAEEQHRHVVVDTRGNYLRTLTVVNDPTGEVDGSLFDAAALEYGWWRAPQDWDGTSTVTGALETGLPASYGLKPRYVDLRSVGVIRALVAGSDASADSVTYDGRGAWRLELAVPPVADDPLSADRVVLTVDKETGFPLDTVELRGDRKVIEHRVVAFAVGAAGARDESAMFRAVRTAIVNPDDDPMTREMHDYGCRRAPLGRFVDLIGRPAIVADWMPDGFQLADATAKTGIGYANDPETSVVYRGGLWAFAVDSYRLKELGVFGDEGGVVEDPIGENSGLNDEVVTLTSGLFKGTDAHVVIDLRKRYSPPHLWLRDQDRGLAVVVLGDLSRDELVAVAESLELGPT